MGLRDKLQTKLAVAFSGKLSDAVTPLTLVRRQVSEEYDPDTGGQAVVLEEYKSRGILTNFHMKEVDGQRILSTDMKCIVLQNELEVIPVVGDYVNYQRVINVNPDPVKATFILQLRME